MNQFQWTFLDNKQQRHTLGIAHGEKSGHLVVHCDHRVVIIDFSILESKDYSFLIEDEFCVLKVIKNEDGEGFTYNFHIDREIDTANNRARAKRIKTRNIKNGLALTAMILGCLLAIAGIVYFGWNERQKQLPDLVQTKGLKTEARVLADGKLEFIAKNEIIADRPLGADQARIEALKLSKGTKVAVLFLAEDASYFSINWGQLLPPFDREGDTGPRVYQQLADHLTQKLPQAAGTPKCALLAANKIGGEEAQLDLVDAFLLDQEEGQVLWKRRFKELAYQNRVREVCAQQTALPSSTD